MSELVVIGAGLTGLFAGALAARRGLAVTVIARGLGSLMTGTGCIDVQSYSDGQVVDKPNWRRWATNHPSRLAGRKQVEAAMLALAEITAEHGYPLYGSLTRNYRLPTAMGAVRATSMAPETMLAGDFDNQGSIGIARLAGFRDFYPAMMAANLPHEAHVIDLDLADMPTRREVYASDLAHWLDDPARLRRLAKAWRIGYRYWREHGGTRVARIALPAVLGMDSPQTALETLQDAFDCPVFEVPVLPPSVPGQRLFRILRADILAHGGQVVLGPSVQGKITRLGLAEASATATGPARPLHATHFLLASGSFSNGGLEAHADGKVVETTFGLPVQYDGERENWADARYFGPQLFARFGVVVNKAMQPVAEDGQVLARNLWAAGTLLAGADRLSEGSREGISLGTAWVAVERIANDE